MERTSRHLFERPTTRRGRTPGALGLAILVLTGGLSIPTASVTAQTADAGSISILIDGPPTVREGVGFTLFLDDEDVTAACELVIDDVDDTRSWNCTDLAIGVYSIELDGVPDGARVRADCTDIVATPSDPDALEIDGFAEQSCFFNVGPSSILFTAFADDPFEPVLLDADDNPVDCIADDLGFEQRRWCVVPEGTYRLDPTSIPDVFTEAITCTPEDGAGFGDPFAGIVVDDTATNWICQQDAIGDIGVDVIWNGLETETAPWFDDVEVVVTDLDGVVQADVCEILRDFTFPGNRARGLSCAPGIGSWVVDLAGVPTDQLDVAGVCDDLLTDVGRQAFCTLEYRSPLLQAEFENPTPSTDPPTSTPGPVQLPETGTPSSMVVLLGAGFALLGVALLLVGRRRPAGRTS